MALWAVAALLLLLSLALLLKALHLFVLGPLHIQKCLRAQGISGPAYCSLFGNLREFSALTAAARASPLPHITHDIVSRVLPHYSLWSEQYGKPFVFWLGWKSRLTVDDPEVCKEVLSNKPTHYPKPNIPIQLQDLLAKGLITLEGEKWVQHRKIVSPAFFPEKLKGMVPTIANLAGVMLEKWKLEFENSPCKEINAHEEFQALTADIIAHIAFGSSYAEGKEVFLLQYKQQALISKLAFSFYFPGSRFLPTAMNRYRWTLRRRIKSILEGIIKKRSSLPSEAYGSDLLGLMLSSLKQEVQGSRKNLTMSLEEIIDECKTFYFAGHETTSSLLTWTVMLLANNSEWQERAREEVLSLFGSRHPDADSLNHLKIIGMILHESLRLYPPAVNLFRQATQDQKLGRISIPKGTGLLIPILPLHVDPELWGADALEFNPLRFANGVLQACKQPSAYMPFGSGPRICVGQNFSMMEAKTVLCMILQKFRFRLSPGYRHAPMIVLALQPQHGMQILLEPVVV
ncbi:hypothetical protein GOP47_0003449 [Adiantum capillus-veneris]|nr:hypothetical protein GOP47_0003449 [Adiantum capillus-veneris]